MPNIYGVVKWTYLDSKDNYIDSGNDDRLKIYLDGPEHILELIHVKSAFDIKVVCDLNGTRYDIREDVHGNYNISGYISFRGNDIDGEIRRTKVTLSGENEQEQAESDTGTYNGTTTGPAEKDMEKQAKS